KFVRQVGLPAPQRFIQLGKSDRSLFGRGIERVHPSPDAVVITRDEAALIWGIALGLGIGAPQVEAEIVELELTHELRFEQLTLEPGRGLVEAFKAGGVGIERGRSAARLLDRVVNIDVGPADRLLTKFGAKAQQAVHDRAIVSDDR